MQEKPLVQKGQLLIIQCFCQVFISLYLFWCLWVPDFFYYNCLYRASAEEAIQKMQGKMIGQQIVRISWGRSPTAKQVISFNSSLSYTHFDIVIKILFSICTSNVMLYFKARDTRLDD